MNYKRMVDQSLKNHNGVINGLPRILNRDTGVYTLGYTKINPMATNPYSRINSHKGWFSSTTDIENGSWVVDRVNDKSYYVMSTDPEYSDGRVAYYDATLYLADKTCSISRFNNEVRDHYGRPVEAAPTILAEGVPLMSASISVNVKESKDQPLADEKIRVALASKYDIHVNDRLTVSNGDVYKVMSVDDTQLIGLHMLYVDRDIR